MLKSMPPGASYLLKTMPVDLSAYLLSSSPPASSFEFLNSAFALRGDSWNRGCGFASKTEDFTKCEDPSTDRNEFAESKEPLKPIINHYNSFCSEQEDEPDVCDSCSSSRSESPSPGKTKKKVSFADHKGLALATVKIMTEPSHMPPRLRPEIISSLTQGATAGVTEQPPLVLQFQQPASDYLAFRARLEHNRLSLENVILRDYTVLGTVKVKNISFEKNVFVRCTFDSWETSEDIVATYVPNSSKQSGNIFDTFSFEIEVPTNFDRSKSIQFAVCFDAKHQQFWDSNDGINYGIVSANFESLDDSSIPRRNQQKGDILQNVVAWTKFACWNRVDTTVPYW
ncbi:protein phosphatase 1 regulatory subunit 3B-like isoform X2 [Mizuhopecten yessoensis]|nr:protein phosphatase 1 regulatory subunit 3B-like isoform X2 [Mizuhopecten yessoensis]XP_021341425.1 protein phosphatase 1 regulatory subunit 3B-like isoform X2 [Mizuhopecten yessoensis]XP_021341426.1 protein phosphatase 1 regulatory subunit 3B-like isoform X2 [Mizuhopecten yessoensis]